MNTLLRWLLLLTTATALLPEQARAEGSKQLTPNTAGTTADLTLVTNTRSGWLEHDANFTGNPNAANVSNSFLKPSTYTYNGSPLFSEDHRMYIRVKAGEVLYYGVHRVLSGFAPTNQADLVLTVKYGVGAGTQVQQTTLLRDQASVRQSALLTPQAGVIASAAENQAGPLPNAGGYTPLIYTNTTGADQDFYIEFTQVGEATLDQYTRFSTYDFWDFTVRTALNGTELPGRLYSKQWAFSAGATAAVFSATFNMFPLVPDALQANRYYVKKFELAGVNPQNFFRFSTNSRGTTASATDFTVSRKSQTTLIDYPEYLNFVNNPDPAIWPSATPPTFSVKSVYPYCGGTSGALAFTTTGTEPGTLLITVDLDGTPGYQPGGRDVVVEKNVPAGTSTTVWNGLDGLGVAVPSGTAVQLGFKSGNSPVNFPMEDAENNANGFSVQDVRPTTGFDFLFWDDSNLSTTFFPTPNVNLSGVNSSGGVHAWGTASGAGLPTTDAGNNYAVNTFTFGNIATSDRAFTLIYNCDADGDGVANANDIDWDNDGISNTEESNGVNPATLTANGVPTYLDALYVDPVFGAFRDINGDGINDIFDLDLDGKPNFLDVDADGDGIPDAVEANGGTAPASYDATTSRITGAVGTNGMPDAAETVAGSGVTKFPLTNTDGSGRADFLDIDSDNDGIPDNIEAQPTATYRAPLGVDTDGDGLDDRYDPTPGGAVTAGVAVPLTNTDGTDLPDYRDTDSDNDGRLDSVEGWDVNNDGVADTVASGLDADQDGLDDAYDTINTLTSGSLANATNGRLPTFYPDVNKPGGDRDWRQVLNVAPVASNVTNAPAMLASNAQTAIQPLVGTDADGTVVNFVIKSLPTAAQGVLYYFDGTTTTAVAVGTLIPLANAGGLRFDPAVTFAGGASFTYAAIDNDGLTGNTATYTIPVVAPLSCQPSYLDNATTSSGLTAEYYAGYFSDDVSYFQRTAPLRRLDPNIDFSTGNGTATWGDLSSVATNNSTDWNNYSSRYRGSIYITTAGSYTFYLNSDDASYLWLDGAALAPTIANALVSVPGQHPVQQGSGTITLTAGLHDLTAMFGEFAGGNYFRLEYESVANNIARQVVPQGLLCAGPAATNNPPVALNATNAPLLNSAAATVLSPNLSATDPEGNATISYYNITTLPSAASGVLFYNGVAVVAGQAIPAGSLGLLAFDPAAGFSGNATFTYSATDNGGRLGLTPATYTVPVAPTTTIAGTVFEDGNYGGGAGRPLATAGTSGRSNAIVELYNAAGGLVATTTTNPSGQYTFSGVPSGTYTVRVVDASVTSARNTGNVAGLVPVQTFVRQGGTADDVNRVGGEVPSKVDAAANTGAQTLAQLTAGNATPQSITTVTVAASPAPVGTVDFGFNFDVITNTNDAGQGSLRQFIANSNGLTNTGLDQVASSTGGPDPAAGTETSIFMIPRGTATAGIRTGVASGLSAAGVAVITPTTALPPVTDASTAIDGTTQTQNVGNTNNVTLGAGGTVGTGATALGQVNGPEVQITGNSSINNGLDFAATAANGAVRGLAIFGFTPAGGYPYGTPNDTNANIRIAANNVSVSGTVVGTSATSFTDPGAATRTNLNNISVTGGTGTSISNSLIGFSNSRGIYVLPASAAIGSTGASLVTVSNNEVRSNGLVNTNLDGIDIQGSTTTVTGNLFVGNGGQGIDSFQSTGGNVLTGNTITGNGIGSSTNAPLETSGVRIYGANNTVSQNVISNNYGSGIIVTAGATTTTISQNAISGNGTVVAANGAAATGGIGIDLLSASDNADKGTAPFVTLNDNGDPDTGANGLINFPIIQGATIRNGNLLLTGFAKAGATIEFFVAAPDGSGFGEGSLYLGTRTEGTADADATTGTYAGLINGLNQGTETGQNRYAFSIPLSSLTAQQLAAVQAAGATLTSTATLAGQGTSEFSGNAPVVPAPVAVSDVASTTPGTSVTLPATANDLNSIDPATVDLDPATPGIQNTFAVAGQGSYTTVGAAAGSVIFTPVAGFTGTVSIPYTVNNTSGITSNVANLTVTVRQPQVDVATAITAPANNATVTAGQPVTFTVVASNPGTTTAPGVVQTLQLPAGLTGLSFGGSGGSYNSTTGLVTFPTIAALAPGTNQTFSVTFAAPAAGPFVGTANVSSSGTETATANNTASVSVNVSPAFDLATTISGPAATVTGQLTTFAVTTRNNGPSPATGVVQTVQLPAGLSGVYVSDNGTYDPATGIVTFPALALASGQNVNRTVSFLASAAGFTASATVNNPGTADTNTANNTATAPATTVSPAPATVANVYTTISNNAPNPAPGAAVTYTVTSGNSGPASATGVVTTVSLPAGLTVTGLPAGASYNAATGVLTLNTATTVASGASTTYTFQVVAPASGTVTATAFVTATTADPMPGNNVASVAFTVAPTADVATTLNGPTSVSAGQPATYTVTTTNNGGSAATGVAQTVQLPVGLTGVTVSGGGTYDATTGVVTFPVIASQPAGTAVTNTISFTPPASGTFVVSAAVGSTSPDGTPANNTASVTSTVTPVADVTVALSGPATAAVGSLVTYAVTTRNNGPSGSQSVTPTLQLPAGLSGVSVPNGTYNAATGLVTFTTIAALATGQSVSNTVTLAMPDAAVLSPVAQVSSATADSNLDNNRATLTTTGQAPTNQVSDLAVVVSSSAATATPGQALTLTATFSNGAGGATAPNVVAQLLLPAGLSGLTISNGGTYDPATGLVTWPTVGSLTAGGSFAYTVQLAAPANGPLTATGVVRSDNADGNTANNVNSASVAFTPLADVTTAVSGPASILPGATVSYAVTSQNNGPSTATNVVQTLTLPAGATNVVLPAGASQVGNVVTFATVASLPSGAANAVTNVVSFTAPATAYAVTGNIATATNQGANTAPDAATANTAIANRAPVALAVVNTLQAPEGNTGGPLAISPLSATDADGNNTIASYTVTSLPPAGQGVLLYFNGTGYVAVALNQVLTPAQAASLKFDPAAGFAGNAFFTYTATDNAGAVSNPALYTISVGQDVNSLYTNTPAKGGNANQYANGDVISNVFDVNGGAYNGVAAVTDNGVRLAATDAAGTTLLAGLGLSLNPLTGQITVADRTKLKAGTYTVSITTVDAFGGTNTQPVTFTIGTNPLPVELTDFTAKAVSLDAQLAWTTASEKNNDHFDVERSLNGTDFVKIGQVKGQGTRSTPTAYALTDAGIGRKTTGVVYYRLNQVDADGTATYSPVRTVAFAQAALVPAITLSPNPATAATQLDLRALPAGSYQVSVLDATGRVVLAATLEAGLAHTLALNTIASGTYIVLVRGQNGGQVINLTKRLIKE